MTASLDTEVLVIGAGAGGAVTAARLAEAGRDVTVVEEGPWIDPDELVPFSQAEMVSKYRHRGVDATLGVPPIAYVEGRCVGGGTEINSALYHRLPPWVLQDWRRRFDVVGFDDAEFLHHAELIEKELGVTAVPGEVPASSQVLQRGGTRLGWDVIEAPRWFPYPDGDTSFRSGVKQTMTRSFVPRATAAGAVVMPGCAVTRLRRAGRRITGADAELTTSDGRREPLAIRAEHVFVCGGAIQSPALLQRSGIRRNVGRGLKAHPTIKVAARFDQPLDDHGHIPMHQVKEFVPEFSFGGSISQPGYVALALADDWRQNRVDMDDWERIGIYYAAIRSDGEGRVLAVPGLTAPLVSYRLAESDLSRLARSLQCLSELLFESGADRLYPSIDGAPALTSRRQLVDVWDAVTRRRANLMTVHLFSSIRMGERRDRTGADSYGRVWGFDNLWVNDASLLPDAPGVNPQGTIMAVASRNCAFFLATS